jgi:hypothetical protein
MRKNGKIGADSPPLLRMLTYDRQTAAAEVQTTANEDPIEMQVEDDDVEDDMFQEKWNMEDEKVLSEQNNGNKRKHHDEQCPKEKILSEQNRERKAKKKGRRRCDRSISGSKGSIDRSIRFCNRVDELIILI